MGSGVHPLMMVRVRSMRRVVLHRMVRSCCVVSSLRLGNCVMGSLSLDSFLMIVVTILSVTYRAVSAPMSSMSTIDASSRLFICCF